MSTNTTQASIVVSAPQNQSYAWKIILKSTIIVILVSVLIVYLCYSLPRQTQALVETQQRKKLQEELRRLFDELHQMENSSIHLSKRWKSLIQAQTKAKILVRVWGIIPIESFGVKMIPLIAWLGSEIKKITNISYLTLQDPAALPYNPKTMMPPLLTSRTQVYI